jgi:hypothetical protein
MGWIGVEPTMFTLRDQFYRLVRNHHPRSQPKEKEIMILDPRGLMFA